MEFNKFATVYPGLSDNNVSRQLATTCENLVASTQFLVALATSESQFRALGQEYTVSWSNNDFPEIVGPP